MNYEYNDFEMEDWDDEDDEVLYESEEYKVQSAELEQQLPEPLISDDLPVLPLRGVVVYPMMWLPLPIGQERSIRLVEQTLPNNRIIALVTSLDEGAEEPAPGQIHTVGAAAQIHRVLKTPDGTMRLLVQGLERIRILEYTQEKPYLRARIEIIPETMEDGIEMEAVMRAVQQLFRKLIELEPQMPDELAIMSMNVDDGRQLAYLVASSMRLRLTDAQAILEMDSVRDKLLRLTSLLKKEVEVLELGHKIQSEAQGEMERMQREFFLREQMKAIQKELGEEDEHEVDIRELDERISKAGMAEEAEKEARRELNRMKRMPIQAAEYSVIKTYLDLLVSLPWQEKTPDNLDIGHARQVLDEDHYGLHEIKERILEFLAVRKLRTERKFGRRGDLEDIGDKIRREREGIVLCFVGPPGVGKTSLGISIARAMNRKFVRLALGGIRDEADIRGFRRTYIGSMPGRIIQSLRRVESKNPVFMLDEVDKLGRDFRGDPSSALLEVLDPEQNREFRDHYLDVPFDLSQVLFITTANVLDTIPPALRDRMEIIQLSSYTEEEKVNIVKGYLIPRQIKENGLRKSEVAFTDEGLREIIQGYTTEAGVRNLERQIGKICRKIAAGVAAGEVKRKRTIKAKGSGAVSGQAQVFRRGSGRARGNAGGLHRPGVDRGGRRHHVLRGDARAGRQGLHPHRPTGRRDEGERARGAQLCAQPRRVDGHRPGFLRQERHSPAHSGRRDSQGWSERGHHDGDGAGEFAHRAPHSPEVGHDRGDHLARQGAAHRRHQGEGAGGGPLRAEHDHSAAAQRSRPGGRGARSARDDEVHPGGYGGRSAGRGADWAGGI